MHLGLTLLQPSMEPHAGAFSKDCQFFSLEHAKIWWAQKQYFAVIQLLGSLRIRDSLASRNESTTKRYIQQWPEYPNKCNLYSGLFRKHTSTHYVIVRYVDVLGLPEGPSAYAKVILTQKCLMVMGSTNYPPLYYP